MKKYLCLIAALLFIEISYGQEDSVPERSRNVLAFGYQIGGYTLIGVNYEIRVHDYFGIHFGMGYSGYTAGLKIHTNEKKNSPFFNILAIKTAVSVYLKLSVRNSAEDWFLIRKVNLVFIFK